MRIRIWSNIRLCLLKNIGARKRKENFTKLNPFKTSVEKTIFYMIIFLILFIILTTQSKSKSPTLTYNNTIPLFKNNEKPSLKELDFN